MAYIPYHGMKLTSADSVVSDPNWRNRLVRDERGNIRLWDHNATVIMANDPRFDKVCTFSERSLEEPTDREFLAYRAQCLLQEHYQLNFPRDMLPMCAVGARVMRQLRQEETELAAKLVDPNFIAAMQHVQEIEDSDVDGYRFENLKAGSI